MSRLAPIAPRSGNFGVVRLVQEVWTVPGQIALPADHPPAKRIETRHPRAHDLTAALYAFQTSATP